MLSFIRALTRGWIARVLLGAIALMMAITLFQGDFIRGLTGMFNPQGVAEVAGESISPQQLQREFDLYLRGQQQRGRTISRQDAISGNLPGQLLEAMIGREAMHAYARRLGVFASDALVAEQVRKIPAAQNELTGRFDRQSYEAFLRNVGYSAAEFEGDMRQDIAAGQVMQALTAGLRAPTAYGELALAFESERRIVSVAEITPQRVGAIPAPTEAQLQAFYQDNAAAFAVPEYRALTVVIARAADFAARVQVPEERVRQEFEARRASLSQPERRTFVQISAPDEAKARDAAARLSRGEEPQAVARAVGGQALTQADKARADVADPAVAEAVFSMRAGAPAQAVHGQLAWAAVRLTSVTAAQAPTYETEHEALRAELAQHEGSDQMDAALDAFDEARSGGQPIAAAARAHGLTAIVIPAVDAQGRTPQGQPAEGLADTPALVETAFDTQEGESTDFMPVGEGVEALVQVDRVTPAATRPFADVRDQLVAGWTARERGRRMREIGDRISAAVAGGQSFAEAARAANVRVAATGQGLDRQTAMRLPDQQLAQLVFTGEAHSVQLGLRPEAAAMLAVYLEEIQHADPAQMRPEVEQLRQRIQQQLGQSMVEATEAAAVKQAHVRRNQARVDQIFAPPDQAQQNP